MSRQQQRQQQQQLQQQKQQHRFSMPSFRTEDNHQATGWPECATDNNISKILSDSTSVGRIYSSEPLGIESTQKPDSSKKRNWVIHSLSRTFWRKRNRTNSISEAELEAAAAADTRASFVARDDGAESPTQLPPPFLGIFRRSFTLPSRLSPNHLDMDNRASSVEDSDGLPSPFVVEKDELVVELQRQLEERDEKMQEIQQEALSSVSQLHELTAIVMEMKAELDSLKAENDRLQQLVNQDDVTPSSSAGCGVSTGSSSSSSSRTPCVQPPGGADARLGLADFPASSGAASISVSNRRSDQANTSAAAAAAAEKSPSLASDGSMAGSSRLPIKQQV